MYMYVSSTDKRNTFAPILDFIRIRIRIPDLRQHPNVPAFAFVFVCVMYFIPRLIRVRPRTPRA